MQGRTRAGVVVVAAVWALAAVCGALTPVEQQVEELYTLLRGQRVGMITNPTSITEDFTFLPDKFALDPTVPFKLVAFFAPEHGLRGDQQAGTTVADYTDELTQRTVYSLYGKHLAPSKEQLDLVDAILFDIQDVGARFYTFVWTMTHAMEACARYNKTFVVLDRPNPIGAEAVEGPPNALNANLIGRKWPNAKWGLPTRHGMTVGGLLYLTALHCTALHIHIGLHAHHRGNMWHRDCTACGQRVDGAEAGRPPARREGARVQARDAVDGAEPPVGDAVAEHADVRRDRARVPRDRHLRERRRRHRGPRDHAPVRAPRYTGRRRAHRRPRRPHAQRAQPPRLPLPHDLLHAHVQHLHQQALRRASDSFVTFFPCCSCRCWWTTCCHIFPFHRRDRPQGVQARAHKPGGAQGICDDPSQQRHGEPRHKPRVWHRRSRQERLHTLVSLVVSLSLSSIMLIACAAQIYTMSPLQIESQWQKNLTEFMGLRLKYLLYN